MLKGREIALTLRSSWIINAVAINVCIINHISTHWTGMEPTGLSGMETGPGYCLCFKIKYGGTICSFPCGFVMQVDQGRSVTIQAWEHRGSTGWLFLDRMGKYCSHFTREGRMNGWEIPPGSGIVFTYLFHCVSDSQLHSSLKQYHQHLAHVVKVTSDLIIMTFNSSCWCFFPA